MGAGRAGSPPRDRVQQRNASFQTAAHMQGAERRCARCGPVAYWTYMNLSETRQMGLRDRVEQRATCFQTERQLQGARGRCVLVVREASRNATDAAPRSGGTKKRNHSNGGPYARRGTVRCTGVHEPFRNAADGPPRSGETRSYLTSDLLVCKPLTPAR